MSQPNHYVLGDYNAACYECGRKFKASVLMKHWRGYYVCKDHWEPRQPQDFVGTPRAPETPPWTQPQQDVFINTGFPPATPYVPGNE
jgi:hypothetical protein